MTQLDHLKERIAYLKFWLGVVVFSDISSIGWLVSNIGTASDPKVFSALIGIGIMTVLIFFMHKRIEYSISTLKDSK